MTVVLDTSAVAAVVFGEPDAEVLLSMMRRFAGDLAISAATAVELGILVEARQGPEASADLTTLMDGLRVRTAPVDGDQRPGSGHLPRLGRARIGAPRALRHEGCISWVAVRVHLSVCAPGGPECIPHVATVGASALCVASQRLVPRRGKPQGAAISSRSRRACRE